MALEKERDPRIENEKDFVLSKKHSNSLKRLVDSYPNGVPDNVICRVLQITPEDLQSKYKIALDILKTKIHMTGKNK